jgi:hypothetical protein
METRTKTIRLRRWRQEEIRSFKQLYPITHNKDLAKTFHRTIYSIRRKAIKLGIRKDRAGGYRPPQAPQNQNLWTDKEIAELRRMYRDSTDNEIAKKLGRTLSAVQSKIKKLKLFQELRQLGLTRRTRVLWTSEDIAILRKLYPVETNVQIAKLLGKTRSTVVRMAQKSGLTELFKKPGPSKEAPWTVVEDAFLKEHIYTWPVEKISKKLGRGVSSVKNRAWKKRWLKQYRWTKQDIAQLQYLLPRCSNEEIAAKLGRGVEAVKAKRKRLGLKRQFWTKQVLAILKKFYPIETNVDVAKRLGKSPPTIAYKARKLGLKKSIYTKSASISKHRRIRPRKIRRGII